MKMRMKRKLLSIMLASPLLVVGVSQAGDDTPPLLFSNTYITAGEAAKIHGNVKAMTYFVSGANAQLGRVETDDETPIISDIQAGTTVTTGAGTVVTGSIQAGTAITLGATTIIGDENIATDGGACTDAVLTVGASVSYNMYFDCVEFNAMDFTRTQLIDAKMVYSNLTDELNEPNMLPPQISVDAELEPTNPNNPFDPSVVDTQTLSHEGQDTYVYNAFSLITGAGVTITLIGSHDWVFNIDNMLSLGAGSEIKLEEDSTGSVTWNVGGYASLGENAKLVGTVLSSGYISTGAGTEVTAAPSASGDYCGGLFSANSYVTLGERASVESCVEQDIPHILQRT